VLITFTTVHEKNKAKMIVVATVTRTLSETEVKLCD